MKSPTESTLQQIERFIGKVAQKFPANADTPPITDIHIRVSSESGEMRAFDDDDQEITRCVVEQWIECNEEDFYPVVAELLRKELRRLATLVDGMGVMKPYSLVLESDEHENLGELYLADDDTVIIGGELMEGLGNDLDAFLGQLLGEK